MNVGGREQGCQPFTLNLLIARTTCPRLFPVINHCALSQHLHCPTFSLQLSTSSAPHSVYPDVHLERAPHSCPQSNYQCKTCASKIGLASTVLIPTLRTTRGSSRHHFWPTAPPPSSMTGSCAHTRAHRYSLAP